VIGTVSGWRDGLREAGIAVVGDGDGDQRADLVVADRRSARELAAGTEMIVVEGRTPERALRDARLRVERYLPWPGPEAPEVLLPLDQPLPVRYAIRHWTVPIRRWKQARNRLLALLLDRGAFPPLRTTIAVGTRSSAPPFLVDAARGEFELPAKLGWFLTLGEGDALTRGVFHLFEPEASEPAWVLKFARVPGHVEPFDRDQRGLEMARQASEPIAGHAPRLIGRFEADGLPASLESAAVGSRLDGILRAPGDRGGKLRAVEAVAAWLVEAGRTTEAAPDRLEPERRRLADEVLPRWSHLGADCDLLTELGPVPAVFEHRDLGSWNVVARPGGFTAVDWESSVRDGFPLWDLLYFLTDSLAHLDGASPLEGRPAHAARLHRGELGSSTILFSWLRRMVDALAIPPQSVGRLATLCWLHHGLSHVPRRVVAGSIAPGLSGIPPYLDGIARLWLTDPALGPGWQAWRAE
jgi:Phosphotransferase enzyme family